MKLIYALEDRGDGSQRIVMFPSVAAGEYWLANEDFCGGPEPEGIEVEDFTLGEDGVLIPSRGFTEVWDE